MALSTITVKDLVLTIPSGVSYLAVSVLKDGGECYKGASVVSGIANRIPQYSYDIPTLYNTEEHKSKLQNLIFGTATRIANYKPITFLHFSDLHKQGYLFARIVQYKKLYSTIIDDIINTGDLVDYYTDAIDQSVGQWNEGKATLSVIGNHDTRDNVDTSDWTAHAGLDAYNKFIAPYIENWGTIIQPQDAATVGKCYYYKDYNIDDSKLRLIVLDNMVMNSTLSNYDATQITWLESVLADAKTNGYTVVGAQHFPTALTKWDSAWCSKDHNGEGWGGMSVFFDAVETFISGGGKFACWLAGHTHNNLLGTVKANNVEYTNQIVIAVDCSKIDPANQFSARVNNTKTMDCFNIVSFDIRKKIVKVLRVGADYDSYMRHAGVLCIDYVNKSIIYEQ